MSEKITKEDGSEVEVFTVEELEAQKQEAIEQYKADNPDKSGEMSTLQEQLEKAQTELEGLKAKDLSFSQLRKEKGDLEGKVSTLTKEVDAKIEKAKKEMFEGVMKDHYNDTLNGLAGGDAELVKKIEYQYKRLGDVASTKEEIGKKLKDAYVLAGGVQEKNYLDSSITSSGGVGRINIKRGEKMSAEEKQAITAMAAAGGVKLDDKDFQGK